MTEQQITLARVHGAIAPIVAREVPMFGTRALMVDDAMLLAVGRDGSLLARVAAARDAELVTLPHARRAEMGEGRSMGEGWIRVDLAGIASDADLAVWLAACTERHRAA